MAKPAPATQRDDPLFGRDDALAELRRALRRAADGRGSYVVVTGEPGIGKTSLVESATTGIPTFWARAAEGGAEAGLVLWRQVARAARRSGRAARFDLDLDVELDGHGPTEPTGAVEVGESGHDRYLRLDRALEQIRDLAEDGFFVVALDDLQWADSESLVLLRMLEAELGQLPMAVVATVRSEAVLAVPRGVTIELGGLAHDAVASIVEAVAGVRPSAAVTRAATDLTGGNPLFVTEVAKLLVGSGTVLEPGAWSGVLPAGVQTVLARRLSRLPAATRDAIMAAAVIGLDADANVLGAVTGTDRLDLYEALQPAIDTGLMIDLGDGRIRFGHALIRDSAVAEIPLRRRQQLHRRTAETLVALDGEASAGAIATHLRSAGDRDGAARWARAAGDRALAAAAPDEATRWYELAQELGDDDPELSLRLAEALSRAGEPDDARARFVEVASVARSRGDAELFGRAALGVGTIGGGFEVRLLDASQIALLEEALGRIGSEPSPVRARLMSRLSVAGTLSLDHERRVALAAGALDEARALADDRALVGALAAWSDAHSGVAGIDDRLRLSEEMVAAATRSSDPELELLARRYRIVSLMEVGRVELATAEVHAFTRLADALRQPGVRWYARVAEGMLALLHGELDLAWELAEQGRVDGEAAGSANAQMLAAGSLQPMILRERGDLDGFLTHISAANEDHHEANRGMDFMYPMLLAGYGVGADAVEAVLDRMPTDLSWTRDDSLHLFIWSSLGTAAAFTGDRAWGTRAYDELVSFPDRFVLDGTAAVCYGPVAATLGRIAAMLGRTDEAVDWFGRALGALTHVRAPLIHRRIQAELDALEDPSSEVTDGPLPSCRFGRDGDTWALAFGGGASRLRDSKGLRDLSVLLARPNVDVHVLDLVDVAEGHAGARRVVNRALGETLDAQARRDYEQRIRDLTELIGEADDRNDIAAAAALDDERALLLDELGASLGLTGRPRQVGSDAERARKAVGMRIRDAIGRIERDLPALGAHLRNSVNTGLYCSYRPEQPVTWHLD